MSQQETKVEDGLSPEQAKKFVESFVYEKDGKKYMALQNYALDFKQEYLYLGMTKTGKAILGEIHSWGPNYTNLQYNKRFGIVEVRDNAKVKEGIITNEKQVRIHTDGFRYSLTLGVLEQ